VKKGSTHVVGKNYDLKAKEVIIEAATSITFKVGTTIVSIEKKRSYHNRKPG
jgi:hypothetical protein